MCDQTVAHCHSHCLNIGFMVPSLCAYGEVICSKIHDAQYIYIYLPATAVPMVTRKNGEMTSETSDVNSEKRNRKICRYEDMNPENIEI